MCASNYHMCACNNIMFTSVNHSTGVPVIITCVQVSISNNDMYACNNLSCESNNQVIIKYASNNLMCASNN